MSVEVQVSVAYPGRDDWPLDGNDSVIAQIMDVTVVTKAVLLDLGEAHARRLGTHLHHADFIITSDSDTVREWGIMPDHHDCPACHAGLDQALARLKHEPNALLVVGQLHWSPSPPRKERT